MSTCLQSINRSLRAENTELLGDVRLCVSHIQSCMLGLAESVRVIEPLYLVVDDLCAKERTLLEQKQRLVDQEAESATEDTTDDRGEGGEV
ncbi:hypothetical protein SARC_15505 [Sphaeroforma arctica JP610]|uniref:Uncharacterized protein n=1 Tax=Sphaeroforma arctica JP610 TaxID=667725 RepID=A0A0L0F5Q0_9EUKA|nr:hypothetical protein SARC_15505 [Sphaeroforma arctica JP610]KNC71949.1 hypothetical protein SARC_15505 [Sphaeroforma arctica JP610]|eukprot:XP_014145851.1 hypothetical protein SARC_15505 [Sphaeroforma arctica JP610]